MAKNQEVRRRGAGRLSAEESGKLEDRLLDAAQSLFVEKGFTGTTMDEIARSAGSSTQTIYSRYGSKSEVLQAVVRRLGDRMPGAVQVHARGADPREYLMTAGREHIAAFARGAAGINRLAMSEAHNFPELRLVAAHGFGRGVERLRRAFEHWREAGVLDVKGDLERAATICTSMMTDRPRIRAVMGEPMSEEEAEAYLEHAVDIFLNGCAKAK